MKLEWNHHKDLSNLEKHGLSFHDAQTVFEGTTITFLDGRKNYGEIRYITFGTLFEHIVVIAHTQRDECIRIISMRKANGKEQKIYQKRLTAS